MGWSVVKFQTYPMFHATELFMVMLMTCEVKLIYQAAKKRLPFDFDL